MDGFRLIHNRAYRNQRRCGVKCYALLRKHFYTGVWPIIQADYPMAMLTMRVYFCMIDGWIPQSVDFQIGWRIT